MTAVGLPHTAVEEIQRVNQQRDSPLFASHSKMYTLTHSLKQTLTQDLIEVGVKGEADTAPSTTQKTKKKKKKNC